MPQGASQIPLSRTAAQHADHTRLRKARVHVETECAKLLRDELRCGAFFERGLGMRVDVVPPALHLGDERGDVGDGLRCDSLADLHIRYAKRRW